jgi:hypothetical protein
VAWPGSGAVKTLSLEGAGEVFALGQNRTLESELLKWKVGQENPKPISIETVADKKVPTDGRRSVELYPIADNGHCASMLMIYFPAETTFRR